MMRLIKWMIAWVMIWSNAWATETVTMDMRNANIVDVVQLLTSSAKINVVIPDELEGTITVKLNDVHWEDALDSILRTKGYAYQKQGDVIRIDAVDKLNTDFETRVFMLKHVDATDLEPFLESILSPKGKIMSFTEKGRTSFAFGSSVGGEKATEEVETAKKSRILSITDVHEVIATAEKVVEQLDIEPQQVSIQVQIVEVTLGKNQDLGIDWNIQASASGAVQPFTFPFPGAVGGPFLPQGTDFPAASGFEFGSLDASTLTATLRMLETTGDVNILSSPKITTLNNLEARILVGERFPITTESIDATTGLRTITLDHYEDIGIQLIVIPQVSGEAAISMIIHPAVSSLGELVEERFPRINTREADTQILIKDGHTVVIGGLLQDQDTVNMSKVPVLGSIPILKYLFQHKHSVVQKVELLIFVTPQIVRGASDGLNRDVTISQLPAEIANKVDKKLGLAKDKTPKEKLSSKRKMGKYSRGG